jgi:hypothetical protein
VQESSRLGQICDILTPDSCPFWPHRFPHFGYIHLGRWGRGLINLNTVLVRRGGGAGIWCLSGSWHLFLNDIWASQRLGLRFKYTDNDFQMLFYAFPTPPPPKD